MLDVSKLQGDIFEWLKVNFPDSLDPRDQQLGVSEEVGELSHAILKTSQGIRGYDDPDKGKEEIKDAVGDIFIYLCNVCSLTNIDIECAFRDTAAKVLKRDWIADPLHAGDS